MVTPISYSIRRFRNDRRGSFSVYAALVLPVALGLAGFGLDYASALSTKARLDTAADTAAVVAVRAANAYMRENPRKLFGDALIAAAKTEGQTAARQTFSANASASLDASPTLDIPLPGYDPATRMFTQNVSYAFDNPLHLGQLVGAPTMTLAGSASAEQKAASYIKIYVLVDTSQSMGIAANDAEMDKMVKGVNCVFACHATSPDLVDANGVAYYSYTKGFKYARENGVKLRIDVARQAIYNMAKSAKALADGANIQFEVYAMERESVGPPFVYTTYYNGQPYSFDNWPQPAAGSYLKPVWPANGGSTTDYDALMTAMTPGNPTLDLALVLERDWFNKDTSSTYNEEFIGDTDLTTSISQFADKYLHSNGDGNSAESPKNYVFVVTDGLDNIPHRVELVNKCQYTNTYYTKYNTGSVNFDWCIDPISQYACKPLKGKGATVGTLYTTYIPIRKGGIINKWGYNASYYGTPAIGDDAYTKVPFIRDNITRCPSDGWFFEASDDTALLKGMDDLFNKAVGTANRLTQ